MKKNQKITKIKHHEHAEREENGYKTVQIANYQQMNATKMQHPQPRNAQTLSKFGQMSNTVTTEKSFDYLGTARDDLDSNPTGRPSKD